MQAEPHFLPAGTHSPRESAATHTGLPARAHLAPQSLPLRPNAAESSTSQPQLSQDSLQVSSPDSPSCEPGWNALQPAAQALLSAHRPLRLLLEQALIAVAPVAGILGISLPPASPPRPADAGSKTEAARALAE